MDSVSSFRKGFVKLANSSWVFLMTLWKNTHFWHGMKASLFSKLCTYSYSLKMMA